MRVPSRRSVFAALLAAAGLFASAGPATAAEADGEAADKPKQDLRGKVCDSGRICVVGDQTPTWSWEGTHSLQLENDYFGTPNDGHFTHGTRYSWASNEHGLPYWWCQLACSFPFLPSGGTWRSTLAVGQSIFTPDDITVPTLIQNDRPYAGWTYGTVGVTVEDDQRANLDTLELTVGIVGPQSYAEDVQVEYHKLIRTKHPEGWSHQLDNEPGIVLGYSRRHRFHWLLDALEQSEIDIMPHGALALGNVFTHAAAGITFRYGSDLLQDYGAPRIQPSLSGSGFFRPIPGKFSWYVFFGVEGRAVARNIFLDGNTFADSHSVEREIFVGDVQGGLVLTYGDWRMSYTQIYRTREFEGQDDPDRFGAVSISVRF